LNQKTTHHCSICGSSLILISEVTVKPENSRFSQTTRQYRCTNQECQDEKDRQTQKRVQLQQEKEQALQKRQEDKLREKNLMKGGEKNDK